MKKFFIIAAIIFCILAVAVLLKDSVIKGILEKAIADTVGAKVEIATFSLALTKQFVQIGGLKIYNPEGFPDAVLLDIPKIKIYYDLASLLKEKLRLLRLKKVDFELRELALTRDREGRLNVDYLKVMQKAKASGAQKGAQPDFLIPMHIDLILLNIDRVLMKDYSAWTEPAIHEYSIRMSKVIKDVTDLQQLIMKVILETMASAGINSAMNYGLSTLDSKEFIPAALAIKVIGNDSAQYILDAPFEKVYPVAVDALNKVGRVKSEDKAGGFIEAEAQSAKIKVKIVSIENDITRVTVSARKHMLPDPDMAKGIINEISAAVDQP
jgi:uncharacterized membrane protein